jgi:predicted transcriptional regulator
MNVRGWQNRQLAISRNLGITSGMKVAISLPDEVFAAGEALARKLNTSRSRLYARALSEFAARHDHGDVTAAMDAALDDAGVEEKAFRRTAARRAFAQTEW